MAARTQEAPAKRIPRCFDAPLEAGVSSELKRGPSREAAHMKVPQRLHVYALKFFFSNQYLYATIQRRADGRVSDTGRPDDTWSNNTPPGLLTPRGVTRCSDRRGSVDTGEESA